METHGSKREVVVTLFLLITAIIVDSVQSRKSQTNDDKPAKAPKGTVQTIRGVGGDIVDCVDIYKQPAFDHPSLKNHTIEMKPSFLEEGAGHLGGLPVELEGWGVDCPEGTVPIIRFPMDGKTPDKKYFPDLESYNTGHEYAIAQVYNVEGTYQGGQATFNVWNPLAEDGEISIAQMWIIAGSPENLNTVEAGWLVGYNYSSATRFFTFWTPDGYKSGCYNLLCPGFVLTNKNFAPGFQLERISKYDGKQFSIDIEIRRDRANGNWYLLLKGMIVGYWPASLFNALHPGGRAIQWGGEITNDRTLGMHTSTDMGSGHFPHDGYFTKSSYVRNIAYIKHNRPIEPVPRDDLHLYVTNTDCYDAVIGPEGTKFGTHFYFGGPGHSWKCT